MTKIKFGTDGWRAVIGLEFTDANLCRISEACAKWMIQKKLAKVVIAYDTRFRGKDFSQLVANVFIYYGISVFIDPDFVSTPMLSFGTKKLSADLGVMITASHNPAKYNGFKLKSSFGGPLLENELNEIEALIPSIATKDILKTTFSNDYELLNEVNLSELYLESIEENFNLDLLKKSGKNIAYDSMYGSGQKLMQQLFPDALHLHKQVNPGFGGVAPEPLYRNFKELSQKVVSSSILKAGFANDGDADRIGMVDEKGNNVDAHHVLLLALYYLVKYKKLKGKVVISAATTEKVAALAKYFELDYQFTKIGFKHIAPIILKEDVLLGGEEAGGHFVKGHIPERDGIWFILLMMEMLSITGKSVSQLIKEIDEIVGNFSYERKDLQLSEADKKRIVQNCQKGKYAQIGGRKIKEIMTVDGYRYYFSRDEWLMIRPSGTEPVLRLYAQSATKPEVDQLLKESIEFLLKN